MKYWLNNRDLCNGISYALLGSKIPDFSANNKGELVTAHLADLFFTLQQKSACFSMSSPFKLEQLSC